VISEAIKLEREKRKSHTQDRLMDILGQREVLGPLLTVGGLFLLQQAGKYRLINRDFAGMLCATWGGINAAYAGITDKYAIAAISAAITAAYAVSTPPTEEEAVVTVNPGKLLGGDGKLFWWDLTWIPGITKES